MNFTSGIFDVKFFYWKNCLDKLRIFFHIMTEIVYNTYEGF